MLTFRMLSLAQVNVLSEFAQHLYDYLPGSSAWGDYTFQSAAKEAGVATFWTGGSKLPAITSLLESTLEQQSSRFVRLVEVIIMHGLKYRRKKGRPVSREDVLFVSRKLRELGFSYSKLSNQSFLDSLPTNSTEPLTDKASPERAESAVAPVDVRADLESLRAEFLALLAMADRNRAGVLFEGLLNRLFCLFDLTPTAAFKIVGEQIDGAFVLGGSDYLLEAKWVAGRTPERDLLVFRGKVEGKSAFTRGLFVAVNGYTEQAVESIVRGKQPNFVMLDGAHLFRVLEGSVSLDDLLRDLVRRLAQQGEPYVPVSKL